MINKYDDFKYIIQDMNYIYFGKELTYDELLEREDVPFKLKAIINSYIEKDTELSDKLPEHILKLSTKDFSYKIFEQLKMNIRVSYKEQKRGLLGKESTKWVHKVCTVSQFCDKYKTDVIDGETQIEELSISKLALMAISI